MLTMARLSQKKLALACILLQFCMPAVAVSKKAAGKTAPTVAKAATLAPDSSASSSFPSVSESQSDNISYFSGDVQPFRSIDRNPRPTSWEDPGYCELERSMSSIYDHALTGRDFRGAALAPIPVHHR